MRPKDKGMQWFEEHSTWKVKDQTSDLSSSDTASISMMETKSLH